MFRFIIILVKNIKFHSFLSWSSLFSWAFESIYKSTLLDWPLLLIAAPPAAGAAEAASISFGSRFSAILSKSRELSRFYSPPFSGSRPGFFWITVPARFCTSVNSSLSSFLTFSLNDASLLSGAPYILAVIQYLAFSSFCLLLQEQ